MSKIYKLFFKGEKRHRKIYKRKPTKNDVSHFIDKKDFDKFYVVEYDLVQVNQYELDELGGCTLFNY